MLASLADPDVTVSEELMGIASRVLKNMADRRNVAAISYEMELDELRRMCDTISRRDRGSNERQDQNQQGQIDLCNFESTPSAMQTALYLLDDQFLENLDLEFPNDGWIFANTERSDFPESAS